MLSFVICQQQQFGSVFHFWVATYSFSASFCELRHSGFSPLCPWQILVVVVFVGPCPVRFLLCFFAGWRSAYLAGGSAFRPLRFVFVVFCAVDLPSYMTTGVHVDVILTCFFSCKDRASERYRPYRRKKKCQCLNSLRIRVEARANTVERAVIEQQLQFMQTRVQPVPIEDLHTADTSCPSRTSADHFT